MDDRAKIQTIMEQGSSSFEARVAVEMWLENPAYVQEQSMI